MALSRAHCQVATLQEAFALRFEDTYVASLRRADDEIRRYQAQRKKLDSLRCVARVAPYDLVLGLMSDTG